MRKKKAAPVRDLFVKSLAFGFILILLIVIPSLDIVVARAGLAWQDGWSPDYSVLQPFLEPIVQSVQDTNTRSLQLEDGAAITWRDVEAQNVTGFGNPPYPPSPVFAGLAWAPASSVLRFAEDSDNWPVTWVDDGSLIGAYGDGWGFGPHIPPKLSLGFSRIVGMGGNLTGTNIPSTGEQLGSGEKGKKASGLLMVDGILYMWVRNAEPDGTGCQLAWSPDHAKTWSWSPWKLMQFGYCTFINFGQNYHGARDSYVYSVTPDHPSAYTGGDDFVLIRVPKGQMEDLGAYEYFSGMDKQGQPVWTHDINGRKVVFTNPGRARRSSITYNAALGRYLWWQGYPHSGDERMSGGFGVFDAPEPWGPWTMVYSTERWDIGPGETASFPTPWMSSDGMTLTLLFSGNDTFAIRQASLLRYGPVRGFLPLVLGDSRRR